MVVASALTVAMISSGTEGIVSVQLKVISVSADINDDFIGPDGAIYQFIDKDNKTKIGITATIKGDSIPERNEEFVVKLVNPTGGAEIAPGLGNNVTVIIEANDGVAGKIGFAVQSRSAVVMEGDYLVLSVKRTLPAAGRVTVDWQLEGVNASADFEPSTGTVQFYEVDTNYSWGSWHFTRAR